MSDEQLSVFLVVLAGFIFFCTAQCWAGIILTGLYAFVLSGVWHD